MSDDVIDVRVLALPVPLHVRTAAHLNGLQRELDLIRLSGSGATGIPDDLRTLIDALTDEYGGIGVQPRAELDAAAERGQATIDLEYRIPRSAGTASQRLSDLLDQVDDFCRTSGHLLTLVTPPELHEYRRWFLGEFTRQSAGEPPVAWPEHRPHADDHGEAPSAAPQGAPRSLPEGWSLDTDEDGATLVVTGPLDLVSAPGLRDLLVEATSVSRTITVDLSGCDFIDSVGVSVLAAALLRVEDGASSLRFRLGEAPRRVLEISGLLDRLRLVDEGP